MKTKSYLALLLLSLSFFVQATNLNESPDDYFEVNLIKNPGAEESISGHTIPSWTAAPELPDGEAMVATYGKMDGEWKKGCNKKCGLPPNSGKAYFRFPLSGSKRKITLYQKIDLTPIAETINERKVAVKLRGFFAGTTCGNEKCVEGRIVETFYDKEMRLLSSSSANVDNSLFKYEEKRGSKMYQFKEHGFNSDDILRNAAMVIIRLEGRKADCCDQATVFFDNISYILSRGELR